MPDNDNNLQSVVAAMEAIHVDDARQVVQSLKLAVAQIDLSLGEAGQSVDTLVTSITSIAAGLQKVESLPAGTPVDNEDILRNEYANIGRQLQQAVTALQFYDRFTQRFSHIRENVAEVISVMSAPEREHHELWMTLRKRMRAVYSLEQEQIMYRAIIEGSDTASVRQDTEQTEPHTATGDIEIF